MATEVELKKLEDKVGTLDREVKKLEELQANIKRYLDIEYDPKINKIIAWVRKLEQKIK